MFIKKMKVFSLCIILGTFFSGCGNSTEKVENIQDAFNKISSDYIENSPGATQYFGDFNKLGLAVVNNSLPYESDAIRLKQIEVLKEDEKLLDKFKDTEITETEKLQKDVLKWNINNFKESEKFLYHNYVINPLDGAQINIPEYLNNVFEIHSKEDAEEYVQLLGDVGNVFDEVIEDSKVREEKGMIPPAISISEVTDQCFSFSLTSAERNEMYISFQRKLDEVENLKEEDKKELLDTALKNLKDVVYPAYAKLGDYTTELVSKADWSITGVWNLPDGEEYYKFMLQKTTSTDLTPDEIHNLGLKEVERIKGEIKELLKDTEYKDLDVPQCFQIASKQYTGDQVFDQFNTIIGNMTNNLNTMFDENIIPNTPVSLEKVPEYRQNSISNYYSVPKIDGSRAGCFYINFSLSQNEMGMPTLAYHETVPGHHLQLTIQNNKKDIPIFNKMNTSTGYIEGWGLYAEKLAYENGYFQNTIEKLGYLQSELFRAGRLVVDTGIHAKKWSSEEAIEYLSNLTGWNATNEIKRYMVWPGQACAYKVGELKIMELREKAKEELGDKFDIKEFHNIVLENGAVPFVLLDEQIQNYIQEKKVQ